MPVKRSRQQDSLATVVRSILADAGLPLPNEVIRALASERWEKPVSAEQLARVASYERENFLRTRMPPLLCSAIDTRAVALRPRVWALGEWRLARRIAAPDVQRHWQAGLALELIDQILLRFPPASERLQQLALEAAARVLGPLAAYLPGDRDQWQELRDKIALEAPDPDRAGHTADQLEAERALLDYEPRIPPVDLYFGLELSALTRPPSAPAMIRLAADQEVGEPFDRVVGRRLGADEGRVRQLLSYLQGWSFVRDELGRAPSSAEFADHWHFDLASVRDDEALFAAAFPEESTPERLIALLEQGLPRSGQLVQMMGIPVIDVNEASVPQAPAPGQRWRRGDGAVLTLSWVDGAAFIGQLTEPGGETSILASGQDKLRAEFELDLPADLWLVVFDVDVQPSELLDVFARHRDIELNGFRRPSDPRPDQSVLRVGTIRLQVLAADPEQAKAKVIAALRGRIELDASELFVRHLGESGEAV